MQTISSSPSGRIVPTIEGQQAFVPNPLPTDLPMSSRLVSLLDRASHAVGELAGVGETIPNPHILIRPLLRREAVFSSQIEGTVASLSEVFAYEAGSRRPSGTDVAEVVNYVVALEYGIERFKSLPISFRLVNELHERLLAGVRGQDKRLGEFRRQQVWIGVPNTPIGEARFIPPPAEYLRDLFHEWERFVNEDTDMPPLVRCALMHYQIEAIHPYSDGNGRIGRLLITLFLCACGVLRMPLLYLSAYFERDRQRYYDELFNVSAKGNWEQWLSYFLIGVYHEAKDVVERIRRMRILQEEWKAQLESHRESANVLRLLERFFAQPITTALQAAEFLDISDAGTRRVLSRLVDAGVVTRDDSTWPHLYISQRLLDEIDRPITTSTLPAPQENIT